MFISKHRRLAGQTGCGVQYIPGHTEPFVDLVVEKYLPSTGDVLDLGGGGLRFAIPVAQLGRRIVVVDLDPGSLDLHRIGDRINENGDQGIAVDKLLPLVEAHVSDIMGFLRNERREFSLISAFRVAHFLTPPEITALFRLAHRALRPKGVFVVSAMTPYNLPGEDDLNEIYRNTDPVSAENRLYRCFRGDAEAASVQRQQNLGRCVHLVDSRLIRELARVAGFDVIVDGWQSTRIVAGYIMRRLNGVNE